MDGLEPTKPHSAAVEAVVPPHLPAPDAAREGAEACLAAAVASSTSTAAPVQPPQVAIDPILQVLASPVAVVAPARDADGAGVAGVAITATRAVAGGGADCAVANPATATQQATKKRTAHAAQLAAQRTSLKRVDVVAALRDVAEDVATIVSQARPAAASTSSLCAGVELNRWTRDDMRKWLTQNGAGADWRSF